MKLYEIAEAYQSLMQVEGSEDLETYLKAIEDEFETKAENIVYVIKDYETDMQILREEEKRLAGKRKSLEEKRDWLKTYLHQSMDAIGKNKLKAGTFDLKIQNNPKYVLITDESAIGEEYIRVKKDIDKQKIKKELEGGAEIPGATLAQDKGLRIK